MKNKIPAFTISYSNSLPSGTSPIVLFDALGVNEASASNPKDWGDAKNDFLGNTPNPFMYLSIVESTITKPIRIKGIIYEVPTSSAFSNRFDFYVANIDGRQKAIPNIISKNRRNTQFQSNLLTIECDIVIDGFTALFVNAENGGNTNFTFLVEELI